MARPQPKGVCLPAAGHPTRHTAHSWQLRAPPGAAVGLLCLLLSVGSSCRGSLKVPPVGFGCQPVCLAAAGCVAVAQAMEPGHGEVNRYVARAEQSWSVPGAGSSPPERVPPHLCPWALFCTSSPARGHRVTFPGGCARAAGSSCWPPAPALGTRTPVLLSLPSWQVTSQVMDRVWERRERSQEQQHHCLSSCGEDRGGSRVPKWG